MTYFDDDERPVSASGLREFARKIANRIEEEEGRTLFPVESAGRSVAKSFWGRAWCRNIESYQDYESRLPRGRSYLKNGTVIDLGIEPGRVTALVVGGELYRVSIAIDPVRPERWEELRRRCAGRIESLVDLVEGKLSESVIELLCSPETGLFPAPEEIHMSCDCPDWADLCKHLAAVLYGVGVRLDAEPELLFVLRGVDPAELFGGDLASALPEESGNVFDDLADTFGIELE